MSENRDWNDVMGTIWVIMVVITICTGLFYWIPLWIGGLGGGE